MEDFELLRREKRRRKAKLKFFGLDVVPNVPDFNKEGLADGFDVNNSCYPSRLVKSTWGDDYDIALYGRLGLHCHNFQKGTNFKFVRWEKYSVISTAYDYVYVTLDAKDPVSDSVFSFQTLLNEDSSPDRPVMWTTLACRIKCENAADARWDDKAVDDFYKDGIPKWSSDEELSRGKKNYYVVQESELQENDWLYLFTEIAFYSKTNNVLTAPPPLEIEKVVVVTKKDAEEGHEKLKAHNAIFYVSYKYNGESSEWAGDHSAVIRKTRDGKPGHMYIEVAATAD
ncbi:PREDICTED: UPF0725 protein At5g63820-like [Brassica oleracea var. oleracea]|uniref:Uncharacterized protein n=1 Tax=Brassica oleracea var. oleracea TaxID=109376 RepID=A0A0D3A3A5_BRAOL|nr:PREDICTED: UPF0725 protein At5g63820-like [Brassica oleracea var. oleracea]